MRPDSERRHDHHVGDSQPLAVEAGLKRLAVVAAPYGLARFAIDEMHSESRDPIGDWRVFTTMGDALDWISGEPSYAPL